MSMDLQSGTMLMQEGVFLPSSLSVQSAPYCDTWRELKGIDTYTLDREVRSSGWNLFFVAGELRTCVRGGDAASVRRGIERLARRVSAAHLNCLQISTVMRKHFLGISYLSLRAHAYHIQDGRSLRAVAAAPVNLVTRIMRWFW